MADQPIQFPCTHPPTNGPAARLLGLYPQRAPGLWMQRVKVPSGRLTAAQWRALAAAARQFTPHTPLHLTTRQDVELHDVPPEAIPALQAALATAALSTVGACGDTLRNITVCPCSGLRPGSVDLHPLAEDIHRTLLGLNGATSLPRKFKIALACSDTCGQPWINDLAFVARRQEAGWGFHVVGAGSLGAKPRTGIVLFDWLPPADAMPLAVAAVTLFAARGDRTNRSRARLRHVRERLGDLAFRDLLALAFAQAKSQRPWPDVCLTQSPSGYPSSTVLTFLNGDLSPDAADALADLAGTAGLAVRIANQHRVIVFARSDAELHGRLAACPALAQPARPQPAIVACPGKTWCARALTDTRTLARRLARQWAHLPPDLTVAISGCPNSCAQSAVADIGLIGRLASRDGRTREVYDLLTGGGVGRNDRLATLIARAADLSDGAPPPSPPG